MDAGLAAALAALRDPRGAALPTDLPMHSALPWAPVDQARKRTPISIATMKVVKA